MAALGIILIAVGAVLRFAVTALVDGVDLDVLGVVLMAVGAVAVVAAVVTSGRFSRSFTRERVERGPEGTERVTEHSRTL